MLQHQRNRKLINKHIDRTLEMTSDALTNARQQCMCQMPVKHTILAEMTLSIMTLQNVAPFIRSNAISDGPTNGMSISQLSHQGWFPWCVWN